MTPNCSDPTLRYTIKDDTIIEETLRECSDFKTAEYVQTKSISLDKILPREKWLWTDERSHVSASIARIGQLLVIFGMHCTGGQSCCGQEDTNVTIIFNMVDNTSRVTISAEVPPRVGQTVTRIGDLLVLHGGEHCSCHRAKFPENICQYEVPLVDKYNDTYTLDVDECRWKKLTTHNPPPPSSGHEARELGTSQLLIWGADLSTPYVLDLVSLEWSPKPMMSQAFKSSIRSIQSTDYLHKDSLDEYKNEGLRYREQMQTKRRQRKLI
ncbi:hypothetical protein GL50803_0014668 [Giardia duodenalis]|uniref:Uncharacterized protein n=1 Tax=Giardia intestinalis (strain ATCC 50803 / WB clone C6) TaxID=184922 RepID=D3KGE9_GIAIC|nr:hypothetical protein GL50803_0014668 [Giardia intestinalis]KAE8301870.1 hypothetical protein GL50803_0014668 [Giardia intestinalis]